MHERREGTSSIGGICAIRRVRACVCVKRSKQCLLYVLVGLLALQQLVRSLHADRMQ
jgi:hypothetical protein